MLKRALDWLWHSPSIVLLIAVIAVAIWQPAQGTLFNGGFIVDGFSRYMKFLVLGGFGLHADPLDFDRQGFGLDKFEYAVLVLLATLGMMVMVSANDLMTLYVGLELQSLALYVVAALNRDRRQGDGSRPQILRPRRAVARACCSMARRWFTASPARPSSTRSSAPSPAATARSGLIFGMVFLLAGIAFKISAVPFHMWTPDVYEGAPTPVTAFFAAAPKVAAMALFIRVVTVSFGPITHDWQQIVIFLSIASMVLAAFAAIGQNNLKRLLAYSSIGHVGFALVGLSAGTAVGVEGVAVYMAIYIAMTDRHLRRLLSLRTENGFVETISRPGRPRAEAAVRRGDHRDHDVLVDRPAAARRVLRQMAGVPRRDRRASVRRWR